MGFTLTPEFVHKILGPTAEGDWSSFLAALDPDVYWIVGDPIHDPLSLAGTYNVESWSKTLITPLVKRLTGPVKMVIDVLDIIGPKAILESSGFATQKNGKPYNNKFCWVLIFSEETGKIVTIREYMNTALTKEVMETNPAQD